MKSWHPESVNTVYYQKRQNKAKNSTLNSIKPKFIKKITMCLEIFGYVKCQSVSIVPDLITALAILSEKGFKRSPREKYILGTGEKSHFSSSQKPYTLITSFSKVSLTTERKLAGRQSIHEAIFWENMICLSDWY